MAQKVLIINFKNYPEILGEGAMILARAAQEASAATSARIVISPPMPMLHSIASSVHLPVFSQKVDNAAEGKSTGAVLPESIRASGCRGSILNHSESRVDPSVIAPTVQRMRAAGLETCVCAVDAAEAARMAPSDPEMIAVEPPELIGSGKAVSKARPEVISGAVDAVRRAGYRGKLLCGAGIVSGEDVSAALRLGSEGVLVASSIVKASDWKSKITELAAALV